MIPERLIRRLKLEEYNYEIILRAGKSNANVDALSQNPITDEPQLNNVVQELKKREYNEVEKQQILYEYTMLPSEDHHTK